MENICQVLNLMEKRTKGRRVIRYMKGTEVLDINGEEFFKMIRRHAHILKSKGVTGKHVGIIGKNSYLWLVNFCAVFQAGAVAVLLDRDLGNEELAELVSRVDLSVILYDASTEDAVQRMVCPMQVEILDMEEMASGKIHMDSNKVDEVSWEMTQKPEELSCIIFTSGTTMRNKAVMLSARAMAASVCTRVNGKIFKSLLAIMPFHHLSGFITVMNAMYLGAEICIGEDIKYFYRYLKYMQPDYVFVVPSMLQLLVKKLKNGGQNGCALGWNLRLITCGGATFCSDFLQMLQERKITVMQGYGASEAGGIGILWEMTSKRPDTLGKPPAEMSVRIENEELYLKSDSLMMGYYDDPEETEKVLRDGWYATGDLCRIDGDGYLYLTGRRKNLIILPNGENISPEEIENKLRNCEEIEEIMIDVEGNFIAAKVFPYYPAGSTEEQKAGIREKIGKIIEAYNGNLPLYKQVMKVHFFDRPFEKNTAGKIIRYHIAEGMV
ncbi:MAG: class I adenylate-forming enzyme family protein [Lachnospiraceae bacterium]|nr:class I adenylate-forming enzyme family protein [Lachnospiraceae bacterium]MDY4970521.1 class I adenylate-forming enzyme family protein [Lachnospiraceae bacterium]